MKYLATAAINAAPNTQATISMKRFLITSYISCKDIVSSMMYLHLIYSKISIYLVVSFYLTDHLIARWMFIFFWFDILCHNTLTYYQISMSIGNEIIKSLVEMYLFFDECVKIRLVLHKTKNIIRHFLGISQGNSRNFSKSTVVI